MHRLQLTTSDDCPQFPNTNAESSRMTVVVVTSLHAATCSVASWCMHANIGKRTRRLPSAIAQSKSLLVWQVSNTPQNEPGEASLSASGKTAQGLLHWKESLPAASQCLLTVSHGPWEFHHVEPCCSNWPSVITLTYCFQCYKILNLKLWRGA